MTWKSPKGELLYRIGDVMISTNLENPSAFFGGTWQLLCPGRTLVCVDTNDNDFNSVKKTGGSKYLQSHNHSGSITVSGIHTHSGTIPSGGAHNHNFRIGGTIYKNTGGNAIIAINGTTQLRLENYSGKFDKHNGCVEISSHSHTVTIANNGSHNHELTINSSGNGNAQNLQPFMAVYICVRIA